MSNMNFLFGGMKMGRNVSKTYKNGEEVID